MIEENPQRGLESIISLTLALEGNRDKELTGQESEKNIRDNLVNICGFSGVKEHLADGSTSMIDTGVGSGLLITTDGWAITAYHNIKKYIEDWKRISEEEPPTESNIHSWMNEMKLKYAFVDQRRCAYPIDPTIYGFNPSLDIALVKAFIMKKPEPIRFRIAKRDLEVGDEIKLFGLRDQTLYNQLGKIILSRADVQINGTEAGKTMNTTRDTFLTDAYGVPGFSGGVFTTLEGEFAGIATYAQLNGGEMGRAGGAKVRNILDFVREMVHSAGIARLK